MNGAHWHLLVNHFPVVLPLIGLPLAVYGAARRHASFQQLGLGLLVLGGIFTGVAFFTGDPAEEILTKYPDINRESIKNHFLAAEWALRAGVIVGLFSAFLVLRCWLGRVPGKALWIAHTIVALWGLSVVMTTTHLGGLIRHVEIVSESGAP